MPVIYGNQNVDERYSRIFEPNLFSNAWLVPGQTCTDVYQEGPAGGYYVHKLKPGSPLEPTLPTGQVNNHEDTADDLIKIDINNDFKGSRKTPNVTVAAMAADIVNQNFKIAIEKVRVSREFSAIACLLTESTTSEDTTAITKENVKDMFLNERTAISEKNGHADVILCSPKTYSAIQAAAGNEFTPVRNEAIQMNGRVADWYGFKIIECQALATPNAVFYYDYKGDKITIAAGDCRDVDFIMYNSNAFSCIDNLYNMRMIDTDPHFAGTYTQCFALTGYRVTNKDLVRVKKHA